MKMDINLAGIPENIDAKFCTHKVLIEPYKTHMSKFKFLPAKHNKQAVVRKDFVFKLGRVTFGKNRKILPGPNGYLTRKFPNKSLPPAPKKIPNSKWLKKNFRIQKPCGYMIS